MPASVAPVSALIGLNAMLPSSLTQISWRMCVVMGARSPAATSASAMFRQRSERAPSGSPIEIRLPSMWRMTPGSTIFGRKIHDGTDDAPGFDGCGDHAAGVNVSQPLGLLEIPPGECRSACSPRWFPARKAGQPRGELGQAVRLYAEKNDIDGAWLRIASNPPRGRPSNISPSMPDPHAVLLHRAAMRAARKQRHVHPGARHHGPDVGPDGARAGHGEFHPRTGQCRGHVQTLDFTCRGARDGFDDIEFSSGI